MTMAISRSRQVLSQWRIAAGAVKSISTWGVGLRSEVIGTPIGPMPATSPASRAEAGAVGALDRGDDLELAVDCLASATRRWPIRPAAPVIAMVVMTCSFEGGRLSGSAFAARNSALASRRRSVPLNADPARMQLRAHAL